MEESNSSATSSSNNSNILPESSEERSLRSQVSAVKPLMQNISSYLFRKQSLVILQILQPDNDSPTAPAHCIHVQHCLVPSQMRVGIASQELVTNDTVPKHVPRFNHDRDGGQHFAHEAEQDNGIIIAIEREDVRDDQEQEMMIPPGGVSQEEVHDIFQQLHVWRLRRTWHYVRYGVGAGTDGRDLKPRFQLPMFVERFYPFCVWGPHVYTACVNYMMWINFSGDEPIADFVSGLREVNNENCYEIFRHERTIAVNGLGVRTPSNTSVTELDMFEYVDIFSLALDGRPMHQDQFYVPPRPYSARVYSLTQLAGPNKDHLLLVMTDLYHHFSQIHLIPTAELREEQHAVEAAGAAPSLFLAHAPTKFVVRDLENGRQELLMSAQFEGLLSFPIDEDFNGAVVPRTLFQPEDGESVRDVQLLDNVPWILVWNKMTRSYRLIKLGQDGTVLKSIPFDGESWRFL